MAQDPLATRPQSVAIVALGPSSKDFITARAHKNSALLVDEVWAVNSGAEVFACDKVWLMDDLRKMQQRYPGWAQRLRSLDKPIVTCRHYPEWPTSVEYPLMPVLKCIQDDFLTNTVAYAIAYAILTKVEDLYLFGCDFMYPGSKIVEPGAESCAYLLGIAKERGVHWRLPSGSTLMDSNLCRMDENGRLRRPLYGYDYNPGDSKRRVERGVGTELDHLVARKAPHAIEGLEHAIHAASAPHGERSVHRSNGGGQGNPVHPAVAGNQPAAVPAERSRILGGRDERRASPGMGSAAHRAVQSEVAGANRMAFASESTAAGFAFDAAGSDPGASRADDGQRAGTVDVAVEPGVEFPFKRGNGAAGDPTFP